MDWGATLLFTAWIVVVVALVASEWLRMAKDAAWEADRRRSIARSYASLWADERRERERPKKGGDADASIPDHDRH